MMSQVTDALSGYGLPTQEALMEQYLRVEPQIVTGMDGSVDVKPCVVGFRRLRELKSIISAHVISRTYGDPQVVMTDGSPLHVPEAVAEEVMIDMSDEQAGLYGALRERARNADARARGPNHPFAILWEMRKLTVDPMLRGVGGPQSAGRVQSAALMLLAQREQARLSFVASGFWRVTVTVLSKPGFRASVVALRGVPLATAASFTAQGSLKPGLDVAELDAIKAGQLVEYLNRQQAQVSGVDVSPIVRRPPPPLTTSGMQQAASARLKFGAAQVTRLAQTLYEQGLITYIRTDTRTSLKRPLRSRVKRWPSGSGRKRCQHRGGSTR